MHAAPRRTAAKGRRPRAAAAALALPLVLALSCGRQDPLAPPARFQPTFIRAGGNSMESFRKTRERGFRFAESDFRVAADDVLISTHDNGLGGDCGPVNRTPSAKLRSCTMRNGEHVATLADFLSLPLDGWFLDLKDTENGGAAAQARAIGAAVAAVERARLRDRVVLMMYEAPAASVEAIRAKGIRAGMKGYPKTREQTLELVDRAFRNRFEMICVKASGITPEIIDAAARKGVWILAWDNQHDGPLWRTLAAAGLGGVITPFPLEAEKEASGHYRPPARWKPNHERRR